MSRYGQRTRIGQAVSNFGQPVARTGVGGYGIATGGTESDITVGGINYRLLTFNSSSTLTITAAGMFDIFQVGGGGGMGGAGATSATAGVGLSKSFTGTAVTYAAGGTGASSATAGSNGTANLGNGANGSGGTNNAMNGGSGVVLVRFKI